MKNDINILYYYYPERWGKNKVYCAKMIKHIDKQRQYVENRKGKSLLS